MKGGINMFLGRANELKILNKRYKAGRFECVVIYGRRRVGKTALINEFCKDKKNIYFSALNASSQENLHVLSKEIWNCKNPDSLIAPEYQTFEDAFEEITRLGQEEQIVFVIDEYPYLAKAENSISSRLQHLIDHKWNNSKLFVILCGSSMSFMEYQVLGYESPLYGRRTAQFKIEPMTYKETAVFNPGLSVHDNALVYGITGGVPHYINKLDVENDLDEALLDNLFERSSYLYEEPENLLKQELREPAIYNSIITAIAGGASRVNEIVTKTGVESGPCAKYLKVLIDLGIVKKETPINEKKGKRTIYLIADNFFRFWYRFVPTNISAIQSGRIRKTYEQVIKAQLSDYMGLIFEQMCRDYLLYYAENLPFEPMEIGQWWGTDPKKKKQIQIDIVATSATGQEYLIGSCKYKNDKIGIAELELLKEYAEVFSGGKKCHYYIFSKGGFTDRLLESAETENVTLLTLEDIYK